MVLTRNGTTINRVGDIKDTTLRRRRCRDYIKSTRGLQTETGQGVGEIDLLAE